MIALGASLIVLAAIGLLVDRSLFFDPGRGAVERIGRAWLLGFGAFGCTSLAVDAIGLGVSRLSVGVALLLLGGLLIASRRLREAPVLPSAVEEKEPLSPRQRMVTRALLVATALVLFLVVQTGWLRPTYQFDALTRWIFKAKVLAVDGTLLGPISRDEHYWFTHQRYPPIVSHVANLPALLSGEFDDRIASAIFPWYAVAIVLVLHGFLARNAGRLAAASGALWYATLPLVAFQESEPPGSGAFSALADIPLSMFVLGASLSAWDASRASRPRAMLEACLLLGCASLTKNEGLAFVAVLPIGYAMSAPTARFSGAAKLLISGLALHFLLWGLRALSFPALDEHYMGRLHADAVSEGASRMPAILGGFGAEFLSLRNWNLTWPALIGLLILGGRRTLEAGNRLLPLVVIGQISAYAFALIISSWTNPQVLEGEDAVLRLMRLTLGRLILHVAPVAVCAGLLVAPLVESRPGKHDA